MILQTDGIDMMVQNMFDAGCSKEETDCFCECYKKFDKKEELHILENRRKKLLGDIHEIQYNIRLLEEITEILRTGGV